MEICVAGLGLIGGSMCMALKRAGRSVYGWNRSARAAEYALKVGAIDGIAEDLTGFDVVFVAMPPEAAAEFINTRRFKSGAVVSDICGVKKWMENAVSDGPFRYVGCHPMAGKEVSTVFNASADLFDRACMVITRSEKTDSGAVEIIRTLSKDMGFKRIAECSAEVHDRKIAYTSQLAHIVSNAYVRSGEICGCSGFTGGSFQDMTRIAGVDENVWASLYVKNRENLCREIEGLEKSLAALREAVSLGDIPRLASELKRGREIFESSLELAAGDGITIFDLKN